MFNNDQPSTISAVPRMVCIGDVHGDLGRLTDILKTLYIIDNNMKWIAEPPNTVVVQMGDQLDSMPRTAAPDWETVSDTEVVKFMDRLDGIAQRDGGRVISLIGNHEVMNILGDFSYVSPKSMEFSGGIEKRKIAFQQGGYMSQLLSKRNIVVKIGNIVFCHGGILPYHLDIVDNNYSYINSIFRKFLRKEPLTPREESILTMNVIGFDSILWTRKYFELLSVDKMDELAKIIEDITRRLKATSIVIGHNTMPNISGFFGGALWFIDAGLSRSYGSTYNEVIEILYDDDPNRNTEVRKIHIKK